MRLKFTFLMSLLCFAFFSYAQTNVALNKQVVVSSGGGGNAIVDGSATGGRWESVHGTAPQWAYIDLGAVYNISQIKITWEAAGGKNYRIEVANDINNWGTPVRDITNNTALENDYTGLSVSGRYVRVYCTERMLPYGYSIYELEVYSATVPANLAPKVSMVAPANNASYATPANIGLEATASDVDGTVTKVEFFNGATKLGEDNTAPYTCTWSGVGTGSYAITAVATDDSGNTSISGTVTVSVELPVVVPQCGGLGMDSDYTYKFSWGTTNPTITFVPNPNRPTVGNTTLILYYNTTGTDPLPGYAIQPNVPFTLNATNGQTIYFYFTYTGPTGAEKNNAAARHQFVVGSCNGTINLALNQPVTTSSIQNIAGQAKNVNDGAAGTRWESGHDASQTNVQWIEVDLGAVYDLTGVNILWEGAKADEYTIQLSSNQVSYQDVLVVTANTAENNQRNHTLTGTGRYLRIYCTKKTAAFAPYGYSIFELQAFGTPNDSTLPVSLINFNSKLLTSGGVNLNWATASEQNNSHFLLERSSNGVTFAPLQKVSSKGSNSSTRLDYQYLDRNPLHGLNYYRLSQVDLNGDMKIVGHTSQNVGLGSQSLELSPNPLTTAELNIVVGNSQIKNAQVSISNIQGSVIFSQNVQISEGVAKITLSSKPAAGLYLVKVADLATQKLIIK